MQDTQLVSELRAAIDEAEIQLEVMRQTLSDYGSDQEILNAPQTDVADMFIVWKDMDTAWTTLCVVRKVLKRYVGTRTAKTAPEYDWANVPEFTTDGNGAKIVIVVGKNKVGGYAIRIKGTGVTLRGDSETDVRSQLQRVLQCETA